MQLCVNQHLPSVLHLTQGNSPCSSFRLPPSVSLLKDSPTGNHLIWTICIDISSPWGPRADGRQQLLPILLYAADFSFLLILTMRLRDTFIFLLDVLLASSKEWPCIYTSQTKGSKVEKHGTQWSQFPRAMYALRLFSQPLLKPSLETQDWFTQAIGCVFRRAKQRKAICDQWRCLSLAVCLVRKSLGLLQEGNNQSWKPRWWLANMSAQILYNAAQGGCVQIKAKLN